MHNSFWLDMMIWAFGMVLGILFGAGVMSDYMKAQAIKASVAHWTIDPVTGNKTFVYNTPVEAKP